MKRFGNLFLAVAIVALLADMVRSASSDISVAEQRMRTAAKAITVTKIPEVIEWGINTKDKEFEKAISEEERKESRTKSLEVARQSLLLRFKKEAEKICEALNVEQKWWKDTLKSVLPKAEAAIEENLNRNFEDVFKQERDAVVEDQRKHLEREIHPSEKEFEEEFADYIAQRKNSLPSLKDFEDYLVKQIVEGNTKGLIDTLAERFSQAQNEDIYSENKEWFKTNRAEGIPSILSDAYGQYSKQMRIVNWAKAKRGSITPEEIGSDIKKALQSYCNKKEGKKHPYGMFPSVRNAIPDKAQELAAQKFVDTLSGMRFPVSKGDIRNIIEKDLRNHKSSSKSRELCEKVFRLAIEDKAFDKYTEGLSSLKKREFREFAEKKVFNKFKYRQAIDKIVSRSLNDSFKSAREDISDDQLKEFFEPLYRRQWAPPVKLIEKHENRWVRVDDLSDLLGISSKSVSSKKLLDETETKAKKIAKELIDQGVDALKRQKAVVEEVEREMRNRKLLEGISSEKELSDEFFKRVKRKYSGQSRKYPELFPKVEKEIKTKADAIWNNWRIELEQKKKEEEKKKKRTIITPPSVVQPKPSPRPRSSWPGTTEEKEGQGEGEGQGQGQDRGQGRGRGRGRGQSQGFDGGGGGSFNFDREGVPDVIIDLRYKGGWWRRDKIEARIIFYKMQKITRDYILRLDEKENWADMQEIQEHFEQWLGFVLRNRLLGDDQKIELYVVTRIFNWKMFYGVIDNLQKRLRQAMRKVGSKNLTIYWLNYLIEDGKYEDYKYKNEPTVPDDFKDRSSPILV